MMPVGERITIPARGIRVRDVLDVGGQPQQVARVLDLHAGARRITFTSGEGLTVWSTKDYTVSRPEPAVRWEQAR